LVIMNEKDVLVARPAAWNVQKMESMPHSFQCRKCLKTSTQQARARERTRQVLAVSEDVDNS
jgi:hypothetical protein